MRLIMSFFVLFLAFFGMSCANKDVVYEKVYDAQKERIVVLRGERAATHEFYDADFVVVGGNLGGIAAALSICASARTCILVEETDLLAGCFADQDTVFLSENDFVDVSGASQSFMEFRDLVIEWYANRSRELPQYVLPGQQSLYDNENHVFCFETDAALYAIETMLKRNVDAGKLTIVKRHKVSSANIYMNRISALKAIDLENDVVDQITGWMIIDASNNGYLAPIAGIDYALGKHERRGLGTIHESAPSRDYPVPAEYDCLYTMLRDLDTESLTFTDDRAVIEGKPDCPLMKEPRRIYGYYRISGSDISLEHASGPRAVFYEDSVGIGYHPVVIRNPDNSIQRIIPVSPYQIPLRALVPQTMGNFIAGGANISTEFVAGCAYRAMSVQWAIGEAAGETAAYCAGVKKYTHEVVNDPEHVRTLQEWLVEKRKVPIFWYSNIRPDSPGFVTAQLRPFTDPAFRKSLDGLDYPEAD